MNMFHKVSCPKCNHSFTFKEVKDKVKEGWLKRFIGKTIFIICIVLITLVSYLGMKGMSLDEAGVSKGFGTAIKEQISVFVKK
jgi:hypothetical protein